MEKKNIVSSDTTPCSTRGCSERASKLVNGRAVCLRCFYKNTSIRQAGVNYYDLANLGADPHLINRHGR